MNLYSPGKEPSEPNKENRSITRKDTKLESIQTIKHNDSEKVLQYMNLSMSYNWKSLTEESVLLYANFKKTEKSIDLAYKEETRLI